MSGRSESVNAQKIRHIFTYIYCAFRVTYVIFMNNIMILFTVLRRWL